MPPPSTEREASSAFIRSTREVLDLLRGYVDLVALEVWSEVSDLGCNEASRELRRLFNLTSSARDLSSVIFPRFCSAITLLLRTNSSVTL